MIICISPNPAIDRRLRVKNFKIGAVNRVVSAISFAGGKAAHVAMAAKALGVKKVVWIGFLGGSTGNEIERQLNDFGIEVKAIQTQNPTRINDEIIDENGQITEILEPGGDVSDEELHEFYSLCERIFAEAEPKFQAVFSGSLPPKVPSDFYKNLITAAKEKGGQTILDTSGVAFLQGLEAQPDLIKPNIEEAENVLGFKIENNMDVISTAKNLIGLGARNVVISLGAKGLCWVDESDSRIFAVPPRVKVNSTVGCGDATVAGLAVGSLRNYGTLQKLRLAVACGAANCLAELPGQINSKDVQQLLEKVSFKTNVEFSPVTVKK